MGSNPLPTPPLSMKVADMLVVLLRGDFGLTKGVQVGRPNGDIFSHKYHFRVLHKNMMSCYVGV